MTLIATQLPKYIYGATIATTLIILLWLQSFVCDSLVDLGFIPDDSPKHVREIKLLADKEITKDTAVITISLR